MTIDDLMQLSPVIPVLVVDDVRRARPIAEALVRGGLRVLEVTLRTSAALDVIAEMAKVDGAVVGAGTVLNPADLDASLKAGAQFIVSPGLTDPLGRSAVGSGVPYLPGVANSADIMRGLDMGLTRFKFFPAVANGGVLALRSLAAVFGQTRFCPTGGVTLATAGAWLAEPAVACVGGSWLVPKADTDVTTIEANARTASGLRQNP